MSSETFDPITNGWHIQRGYEIVTEDAVVEDQRDAWNVTSTRLSERPRRTLRNFRMRADTRAALDYYLSFFNRQGGPAARFYFAWPELVPSPDKAPTLEAVSSGTQSSRTITVRFSWKNTAGTTLASPTGSLLVPANNLIKVTVPTYPPNVTQAVIFAAEDDAGNEEEQTTLTNTLSWTQPDAALLTGTADPPTANTATETPLCKLAGGPRPGVVRGAGTTYEVALTIEEVYAA